MQNRKVTLSGTPDYSIFHFSQNPVAGFYSMCTERKKSPTDNLTPRGIIIDLAINK